MADKEIKLKVDVSDKGTSNQVANDVQKMREGLLLASKAARSLSKNISELEKDVKSTGKSAEEGLGPNSGLAAALREQHKQFDIARGAASSSGAAARDFANQSRGLGGVVRIYATLAANIFAVGSAFRALSDAMQISNMVKGLDQLGAAVGRNLGGLSQRFVEISGGAISLAEGMRAVAQTSSGGLGARDIERLAAVARSASAALGVAMPDAVNRLSRGITKLEPELLDELGIMTRLEPAVDLYARQVGKASSQLTQFERRQAFANAVLAEGEEKFGAISDLNVNPYDRLISALKDITQVGTEVVNIILTPIVEILSKSPSALALALTAVGATLLKSAIPAITSFREGIQLANEAAAELAENRAKAVGAISEALQARSEKLSALDAQARALAEENRLKSVDRGIELQKVFNSELNETSRLGKILLKDSKDLTQADVDAIQAREQRLARRGPTKAAAAFQDVRKSLAEEVAAEKEIIKIKQERFKIDEAAAIQSQALKKATELAEKSRIAAIKQGIVANAAQNASLVGVSNAFKLMKLEIEATNLTLTGYQAAMLKARAASAIFFSAFFSAIGSLSTALNIIAVLAATVAVLTAVFSDNEKELGKSRDALEAVNSSAENVNRTLKNLEKQGLKGSIEGAFALANAFSNVSESAEELVETSSAARKATTGWLDSIINSIRDTFLDSGIESNLSKGLAKSIQDAIKLADTAGASEELKTKLSALLGTGVFDTESLRDAIGGLGEEAQLELAKVLDQQNTLINNASSRLQQFKSSTESANLVFAQFIQTTSNNDPIFRVGAALQTTAREMFNIVNAAEAGASGIDEITAAMRFLVDNPDSAILFGPEFVDNLLQSEQILKDESKAIAELEKQLVQTSKNLAKVPFNGVLNIVDKDGNEVAKSFKDLEDLQINLTAELDERVLARSELSRKLFVDGMQAAFKRGADLIETAGNNASARASLIIQKAALSGLTGEERARKETDLAVKDIDLKIKGIEASRDLIISQERLRVAVESLRAEQELSRLQDTGASKSEIDAAKQAASVAKVIQELIQPNASGGFTSPTFENALATQAAGGDEFVAQLAAMESMAVLQRLAAQDQAKTLALAERQAALIEGNAKIIKGRLQDELAILSAKERQVTADLAAQQAAQLIAGINTESFAQSNAQLQTTSLILKQVQERKNIEAAIAIAASDTERAKQESLLAQMEERHEAELTNQLLVSSQSIIAARTEDRKRELDLIRTQNEASFLTAQGTLDLERARVDAMAQISGMSQAAVAVQQESFGVQRAELEYVRQVNQELLALSQERAAVEERIATLDPVQDADTIAVITREFERQEAATNNILSGARARLNTERSLLSLATQRAGIEAKFNRALTNSQRLADRMSKSFGKFGSVFGNIFKDLSKSLVALQQSNIEINTLFQTREKLAKQNQDTAKIDEKIAIAQQQRQITQINNYGELAGAAKGFFDEQSTGYKILEAAEKAYTLVSLALTTQRMISDLTATEASLANNTTRMVGDVAAAEVSGVAAVVNAMKSLPFPASLAAGALMAAVVAAILASVGGKGPKKPGASPSAGLKAADVQEVQGSGLTFRDGVKVERAGGILGASSEKSEDIKNSLDLIEEHTDTTSRFGQRTLGVLQGIEQNTRNLAASAFATTDIGKLSSGFGTVEDKTGSKRLEIIDKGVIIQGTFDEILSGIGDFLEFETIEKTRKKKGFLGIGKSNKVTVDVLTKDLQSEAQGIIVSMFAGLTDAAVIAADKLFGEARAQLINSVDVDFKVSGLGLEGEDLAEAIQQEAGIALNQILEASFPVLREFQQLGEGFTTTIIRMAATMDTATTRLNRFGDDLLNVAADIAHNAFLGSNITNALEEQRRALQAVADTRTLDDKGNVTLDNTVVNRLADAERNLALARAETAANLGAFSEPLANAVNMAQAEVNRLALSILASSDAQHQFAVASDILSNRLQISADESQNAALGITDSVRLYVDASRKLSQANSAFSNALEDQSLLNIRLINALVEGFGGLESFIEKTDFFFENFFTQEEQLAAKTNEVNKALADMVQEGILTTEQFRTLTDGMGDLRLEYREITLAQEKVTQSGIEAANALFSLAPAIADISDEIEDAVSTVNKTVGELFDKAAFGDSIGDSVSELLSGALTGGLKSEEIRKGVADAIIKAFDDALSQALVDELTGTIVAQIVNPILTGAIQSTVIASNVVTQVMDDMLERVGQLNRILADPKVKTVFNQLFVSITSLLNDINSTAKDTAFSFSELKIGDLRDRIAELNEEIEAELLRDIISLQQERLSDLQDEASALEEASRKMRDFSESFFDFRQSLLVSNVSPLTPEEKLDATRANFTNLVNQALSPSSTEQERDFALERINQSASDFLEASQVFFASSSNFIADFNFVQQVLKDLEAFTGGIAAEVDPQLNALKILIKQAEDELKLNEDRLKLLEKSDNELEELNAELDRIRALLAMQPQIASAQFVDGFNYLDRNLDNVLTFEELQRSGIASDETLNELMKSLDVNKDDELSRFEVIDGALGETAFTLQSLADIVANLNANIITISQAQASIADIQGANVAGGAGLITGSTTSGGAYDISGGQLSRSQATIEGANVIIKSSDNILGVPISLSEAKQILLDSAQQVIDGNMSARVLYDQLIKVGATSQVIADILGGTVTADAVNDFFQSRDPSIPSFFDGINEVPEDMFAKIHKGERIFPAADNEELLDIMAGRRGSDDEVVIQLRQINQRLISLEASNTVATKPVVEALSSMINENRVNAGAVIEATVVSNMENAEAISNANSSISNSNAWFERTKAEVR